VSGVGFLVIIFIKFDQILIKEKNNNLKQRIMGFYKLEIDGSFRGHFKTPAEAMAAADKWARPFKKRWVIKDPFNKVYAQG
jgi:hypothetical protein